MKIRALANGNVIDADDGAAEQLIAAGIYVKAGTKEKLTSTLTPPVPVPVEPEAKGSSKVSPMTTASMPKAPKKGKPIK